MLCECPLDRPQFDLAATLDKQLLHDDGVSLRGRVEQTNHLGTLRVAQAARGRSPLNLRSGTATEISTNRRAAHRKLTRDAADAPTHFEQSSYLAHDLGLNHRAVHLRTL
jgi:hypothetical protein